MKDTIQNQYEFFIQRTGGPPLYSQRKGHPALIGRHATFDISLKNVKIWLQYMRESLDAIEAIDNDSKERLWNYLQHTAYFLHVGTGLARERMAQEQQN